MIWKRLMSSSLSKNLLPRKFSCFFELLIWANYFWFSLSSNKRLTLRSPRVPRIKITAHSNTSLTLKKVLLVHMLKWEVSLFSSNSISKLAPKISISSNLWPLLDSFFFMILHSKFWSWLPDLTLLWRFNYFWKILMASCDHKTRKPNKE